MINWVGGGLASWLGGGLGSWVVIGGCVSEAGSPE